MTDVDSIRDWFAYNSIARRTYLETLSRLPPGELTRDRGASFPTLVEIFRHSLDGTSSWIGKVSSALGSPLPAPKCPQVPSLSELRVYDESTNRQADHLFSHLTERDLDKLLLVREEPPWWDMEFKVPIRGVLLQAIGHELQHRGELNALLWQIDVEPPITDWPTFHEAQTRQSVGGSSGVIPEK